MGAHSSHDFPCGRPNECDIHDGGLPHHSDHERTHCCGDEGEKRLTCNQLGNLCVSQNCAVSEMGGAERVRLGYGDRAKNPCFSQLCGCGLVMPRENCGVVIGQG